LRDFFQAFIISSKLGVLKPDGRIYQAALREIGCPPEKVLFVDDDPDYVRAAESLGMWGTVISREGRANGGERNDHDPELGQGTHLAVVAGGASDTDK
jgi:FMN phosphatase YigB (HAD superfamily)